MTVYLIPLEVVIKVVITFQMGKNRKLKRQRHNQKEYSESGPFPLLLFRNLELFTRKGAGAKSPRRGFKMKTGAQRNKVPKSETNTIKAILKIKINLIFKKYPLIVTSLMVRF